MGDPTLHKFKRWESWMKECGFCGGAIFPIKAFEQGPQGQREVEFGPLVDAPDSWGSQAEVPVMGVLRGAACQKCFRVTWFAVPYREER